MWGPRQIDGNAEWVRWVRWARKGLVSAGEGVGGLSTYTAGGRVHARGEGGACPTRENDSRCQGHGTNGFKAGGMPASSKDVHQNPVAGREEGRKLRPLHCIASRGHEPLLAAPPWATARTQTYKYMDKAE